MAFFSGMVTLFCHFLRFAMRASSADWKPGPLPTGFERGAPRTGAIQAWGGLKWWAGIRPYMGGIRGKRQCPAERRPNCRANSRGGKQCLRSGPGHPL